MAEVTRRSFLRNSGLAVAAAGVVSQLPLLGSLVWPGGRRPAATGAADAAVGGNGEHRRLVRAPRRPCPGPLVADRHLQRRPAKPSPTTPNSRAWFFRAAQSPEPDRLRPSQRHARTHPSDQRE